ncbi:contact-dependent growth inhibition system immunity protein [Saccharothrix longispora]|uniref:contact-dependent growth inhibition system immunity protein n=1 Tax=Saccharothrix longispora TaxID=33920 RepID=UPI0028FD7C79|nr:contact-dependent growth inhibition system immunity protein [Saccharothrix longispora]MDU0290508.1 contact-dependent growth inhibition system immunity protein [Saccharothrix longispora]
MSTLQELEGTDWGDPPADATHLIRTVHRLRRKPIAELDTEDLRVLIGQQVGLRRLVPLALEVLREDPLAEGHLYAGDLRDAVRRLDDSFWAAHPELTRP